MSLGFCPPQPYHEPEPSVAEPPSCPLALDMSLRDASYSVVPGPCVVAQLPSEDTGRLAEPPGREHGFLRTKIKARSRSRARAACPVEGCWETEGGHKGLQALPEVASLHCVFLGHPITPCG